MFRNVFNVNVRWWVSSVCAAVMIAGVTIAQTPSQQGDSESESVEARVRASFETQMELQSRRIELAEQKLAKIKQRYRERLDNAEQLIAQQVATLMEDQPLSEAETDSANVAKMQDKKPSTNELENPPASVLSAKGWQLWRERDLDGALSAFEAAAAKSQTDANIYNGLGWTLCNMGKYEESLDAFEEAVRIEPQHGAALNGIGQSYRGLGRLEDAEKALIKATDALVEQFGEETTIRQDMTASWVSLIEVAIERENWDLAIKWAELYLKHKSDDKRIKAALKRALESKQ